MAETTRKIVAVGDLHGDFYRLVRLLSEENVLNPDLLDWSLEATHCDVICLGDYVDWRGERLEGPAEEWPQGAKRIIELLYNLSNSLKKSEHQTQNIHFHPLLGNHDAMMLESYEIIQKFSAREPGTLQDSDNIVQLLQIISSFPLEANEELELLKVDNWITQGGENTISSFGGLKMWISLMGSELGDFLRSLPLAVVVNQKLFCHSVPDSKEYWVPVHEGNPIPKDRFQNIREQYLWGRKIWGYDAFLGTRTKALSEEEVDEMLKSLGVNAVVVGHTSLHKNRPYFHFGGKVINLDMHGIPGTPAFVEKYETTPKSEA